MTLPDVQFSHAGSCAASMPFCRFRHRRCAPRELARIVRGATPANRTDAAIAGPACRLARAFAQLSRRPCMLEQGMVVYDAL